MSTPKDGGPAFPQIDYIDGAGTHYIRGMTLRDYFAAKAMAAMLTSVDTIAFASKAVRETDPNITPGNAVSVLAYNFADTMLAARERKGAS